METFSLLSLNEFIRRAVAINFTEAVWVTAEIAQLTYSRGNCFLDLIEKLPDDEGGSIVAQINAVIWSPEFKRILRNFGNNDSFVFSEGVEIRLRGRADFHERYGLKFIVEDIDLTYSLGKLGISKRNILATLEKEELLTKNKSLTPPSVWQRIAVISSENAAGWQDFREHLKKNNYGYTFHLQLFNASMQGNLLEKEITTAFENIDFFIDSFDAIVIVRGGGARIDLVGFDNLAIARAVANAQLPVLTGIGHDVDETITDLVAFESLKTPTAVADFLIAQNLRFESKLIDFQTIIKNYIQDKTATEGVNLLQMEHFLAIKFYYLFEQESNRMNFIEKNIQQVLNFIYQSECKKLDNIEKMLTLLSLDTALKRGFSLIQNIEGQTITNFNELAIGDLITTISADGQLKSRVEDVSKKM